MVRFSFKCCLFDACLLFVFGCVYVDVFDAGIERERESIEGRKIG